MHRITDWLIVAVLLVAGAALIGLLCWLSAGQATPDGPVPLIIPANDPCGIY